MITQASMLADAKKLDAAAALLRKAIADSGEKPHAVFFLMLAAVENRMPPGRRRRRPALAVIDQGLAVQPDALELVKAKYQLVRQTGDDKAAVAFVAAKAKDAGNDDFAACSSRSPSNKRTTPAPSGSSARCSRRAPRIRRWRPTWSGWPWSRRPRRRRATMTPSAGPPRTRPRPCSASSAPSSQATWRSSVIECDLAARRGDLTRAAALTQEMDKIAKNSTVGPLIRASLYAAQGRTREVAGAYAEALERNPRQPNVRIRLGQTRLKLGEADEALRQAKLVLDVDKDQPDALLLQARALAEQPGTDSQVAARRPRRSHSWPPRSRSSPPSPTPITRAPRSRCSAAAATRPSPP